MGRYSYEPIEARLVAQLEPIVSASGEVIPATDARQADVLGVTRRAVLRYKCDGIPAESVEALAKALGLVAWEVWPELLAEAMGEVERTCAAELCEARFLPPLRGFQKFCGQTCRRREKMRRYRSRPNGALVNRTHRARYYAENGDYERAQKRKKAA